MCAREAIIGTAAAKDTVRWATHSTSKDFYAWTQQQATELLRTRKLDCADLDNIAEEIESMGRSEKRELTSRLAVLLLHLLKWQHQPAFRGNSWRLTIKTQRNAVIRHLRDNPSLEVTSN